MKLALGPRAWVLALPISAALTGYTATSIKTVGSTVIDLFVNAPNTST